MRAIALTHAVLARPLRPTENRNDFVGSFEMHTMHEALAREHMRQLEGQAQRYRRDTATARRHLRTTERRARRAHRVAVRSSARPSRRAGTTAD